MWSAKSSFLMLVLAGTFFSPTSSYSYNDSHEIEMDVHVGRTTEEPISTIKSEEQSGKPSILLIDEDVNKANPDVNEKWRTNEGGGLWLNK